MLKNIAYIIFCFVIVILLFGCERAEINQSNKKDIVINEYGNTQGNIGNGTFIAKQGDWLYYANHESNSIFQNLGLYKVKVDGTKRKKLSSDLPSSVDVVGDWIYYTASVDLFDKFYLIKIKTDGTQKIVLSKTGGNEINVVKDWIYYLNPGDSNIYKMSVDGKEITKISDDKVSEMIVLNNWIYYSLLGNGLNKIKIDGSEKMQLIDDCSGSINIAGGWIYYSNYFDTDKIYRIKVDGSKKEKITDDRSSNLNVVGDVIYYTNNNVNESSPLYKINTDGTGRKKLCDTDVQYSINIIDEWIYLDGDMNKRINIHDGTIQDTPW